jgi:NAD(P)H-dependent FMN reductase
MQISKIAIIVGTTRPGRFADKPTQWIVDQASRRQDFEIEVLDLRDFPLPFFEERASNAHVPSKGEVAQRWQRRLMPFDGYIFVTGEYNHSISAVLKNALDYAYPEWVRKPAAFVGYGMVGAARAIQHLQEICVELQMAPLRHAVHIQGADFRAALFDGKPISEMTYLEAPAQEMFNQLVWWSTALKTARQGAAEDNTSLIRAKTALETTQRA